MLLYCLFHSSLIVEDDIQLNLGWMSKCCCEYALTLNMRSYSTLTFHVIPIMFLWICYAKYDMLPARFGHPSFEAAIATA